MEVIKLVFYALVALFILVTFHEFGHYWVARRCGVKVLRFSIGFGPVFLRKKINDTEFALSIFPLGGYVKMFGEGTQEDGEEISTEDEKYSFSHKSVWQRMAIVVAGPVANFILAIFFYFMVFMGGTTGIAPVVGEVADDSVAKLAGLQEGAEILAVDGRQTETWEDVFDALILRVGDTGVIRIDWGYQDLSLAQRSELSIERWQSGTEMPDLLGSLGIEIYRPEFEAVVAEIVADSPAALAGMEIGDRVIRSNGILVTDWEHWVELVRASSEKLLRVEVERETGDGLEIVSLSLTPQRNVGEDGEEYGSVGIVAVSPSWDESMIRKQTYGPIDALLSAANTTWDKSIFILSSLKKLIVGEVSTKSIGGPISIAKFAGDSAEAGWQAFFKFIAIMSVMLAVMNLLPIPVLDGGHLLFYIVEAVKGSPLNETIQGVAMRLGMTAVFGIMLLALYNDFARL